MVLIAQNNLEFILEFAILVQVMIVILFNLLKISLSRVMLFSLVLAIGLSVLFTFDVLALFIPVLGLHEFTHTYGPIAVMAIVTAWAALSTMSEVGIGVLSIKRFVFLLIIIITIVGGSSTQGLPYIMAYRPYIWIFPDFKIFPSEIFFNSQENSRCSRCDSCWIHIVRIIIKTPFNDNTKSGIEDRENLAKCNTQP